MVAEQEEALLERHIQVEELQRCRHLVARRQVEKVRRSRGVELISRVVSLVTKKKKRRRR